MTSLTAAPRLNRSAAVSTGADRAPVRIVHLGVGAFHRAHQAWYTSHAEDSHEWGIAAFTGRSPDVAEALGPQGGLYTLIERGIADDRVELVSSIVEVHRGDDLGAFVGLLSRDDVAILSLTITEAGYRLSPDRRPELTDPEVVHDVEALRLAFSGTAKLDSVAVRTALGRVLLGLEARRRAGAGPLAVLPCDNMPSNGRLVRDVLYELAELVQPELAQWLAEGISVISTSVDRITPRTTDADRAEVLAKTGWRDEAPVVCEPFSDWVMSGVFPSGRPAWESAGARFVDDIEPWEARKLWMLNGAHTVLAALGPLRGHRTVSEAIQDPLCLDLVTELWEEDARHLGGVDVETYARELIARFRNPRIEHRLAQIASDAETKVRLRIAPVAARERAAGRAASACATAFAAWILAEASGGGTCTVPQRAQLLAMIGRVDASLGADPIFYNGVEVAVARLAEMLAADHHPNTSKNGQR